ncbi:hypothetical protein [Flexivirga caeni]|uniref:Uncharacterized protein n=1 Tax=Flexivirga caeni TaxID=2294115 RepID=A0A3M9MH95_9MICO|nr:hypothetical protein [Flexivirga caeni]RNI24911.1 hypothetical protein EFY87_04320 [Flexivirga caeni]
MSNSSGRDPKNPAPNKAAKSYVRSVIGIVVGLIIVAGGIIGIVSEQSFDSASVVTTGTVVGTHSYRLGGKSECGTAQ